MEKTETLLRQNPEIRITIVAPLFNSKLKEISNQYKNISCFERAFEETDLLNKDFVIITTDKPEVNLAVRELAKSKGIKVNAADQPALCDFYLGSIINKGSLKIAISTNGKSPVLAKRMREYFTEVIPDNIEDSLTILEANIKVILEEVDSLFSNYVANKTIVKHLKILHLENILRN